MPLDFHGFSFRGHCFPTNTTGVRQRSLIGRKTRWINLFFSSSFFFLSSAFEANEKCILSLWLLIEFLTSPLSTPPLSPPPCIPWWDGNPPAPATIWWEVCRLVGVELFHLARLPVPKPLTASDIVRRTCWVLQREADVGWQDEELPG